MPKCGKHERRLHFAGKYAPLFLKTHLQQILTAQKISVVAGKFFVFESTFECAPKVISTGAGFFAKRLGIAFTFQTDVRSRWGKKLRKLECYQRICRTQLAVLLKFSAESQTSFKSNSKNFLRSQNFLSFSKRSPLI